MTDFTTYPRQDFYESELDTSITATDTTIQVADAVDFTLSSGSFYAVIDPEGTQEVVEVTNISGTTWTVVRGIALYEGDTSGGSPHGGGVPIILANNWKHFDDIQTAIASKLDLDGGNGGTTFDFSLSGSNWRIRKDGSDMKLTDDNQSEVTLSTLAAGGGADEKTKVSNNDTTAGYLDAKITGGDGIELTELNDGGDEDLEVAIDLAATNDLQKFTGGELDTNLTATKTEIDQLSGTTNIAEADTFFGSTDISGAEAETLTDGSNADALHVHGYTHGVATRTSGTGTGTETITHGLGVTPSHIKITTVGKSSAGQSAVMQSIGAATGTGDETCVYWYNPDGSLSPNGANTDGSNIVRLVNGSTGTVSQAAVTGIDGTDITLDFTTHSVTAYMLWEAYA